MRDCDFVAASSEVVVDWLHLVTVSRKSRPPLRYEFHVEDPLDAALASETLRLCARDGIYAVAGAVAASPRHRGGPSKRQRTDARARRPAMIAPKTFDAFRLRRPQDKTKDVLDARTLKKVRAELEPKLARRGKAVARETLDLAKIEKLLKSVDSNATSKDAERALRLLDFDERGTVDAFAAYRYALEATPQLLRQRAAGAAPPRPLLKEEDAFAVPTTGVLQLRCFLERTVRGSRSANVLKLAQDLDDCVAAADLACQSPRQAGRRRRPGAGSVARSARRLHGHFGRGPRGAADRGPEGRALRPRRGVGAIVFVQSRRGGAPIDCGAVPCLAGQARARPPRLPRAARRPLRPRFVAARRPHAALRELFAVDAFRNCRVDGSSQPLGITIGGEPKRDAQLAALFASEGAPSLGSRTDGLVVLDVASRPAPTGDDARVGFDCLCRRLRSVWVVPFRRAAPRLVSISGRAATGGQAHKTFLRRRPVLRSGVRRAVPPAVARQSRTSGRAATEPAGAAHGGRVMRVSRQSAAPQLRRVPATGSTRRGARGRPGL